MKLVRSCIYIITILSLLSTIHSQVQLDLINRERRYTPCCKEEYTDICEAFTSEELHFDSLLDFSTKFPIMDEHIYYGITDDAFALDNSRLFIAKACSLFQFVFSDNASDRPHRPKSYYHGLEKFVLVTAKYKVYSQLHGFKIDSFEKSDLPTRINSTCLKKFRYFLFRENSTYRQRVLNIAAKGVTLSEAEKYHLLAYRIDDLIHDSAFAEDIENDPLLSFLAVPYRTVHPDTWLETFSSLRYINNLSPYDSVLINLNFDSEPKPERNYLLGTHEWEMRKMIKNFITFLKKQKRLDYFERQLFSQDEVDTLRILYDDLLEGYKAHGINTSWVEKEMEKLFTVMKQRINDTVRKVSFVNVNDFPYKPHPVQVANNNENCTMYQWAECVRGLAYYRDDIWAATTGGLVRINSSTKKQSTFNRCNSGLPYNRIGSIVVHDNQLWVGTDYRGVASYDGTKWQIHSKLGVNALWNSDYWINQMVPGPKGGIWLTMNRKLKSIFPDENSMLSPAGSQFPAGKNITLCKGPPSYVWIKTARNLIRYDGENRTAIPLPSDKPYSETSSIVKDSAGFLWLSIGSHLYKRENNCWSIKKIPQYAPNLQIYCLAVDSHGNIWAGLNHGLIRYDHKGWIIFTFFNDKTVKAIEFDSYGTVWIGTNKGLYNIEPKQFTCDRIRLTYGELPGPALELQTGPAGHIWAIGEQGVSVFRNRRFVPQTRGVYKKIKNEIKRLESPEKFPSDLPPSFLSIKEAFDSTGILWLDPSIKRLIYNGNEFKQYWHYVKSLNLDKDGDLWVSCATGLFRFDGKKWFEYTVRNAPFASTRLRGILFDKDDYAWVIDRDGGILRAKRAWLKKLGNMVRRLEPK